MNFFGLTKTETGAKTAPRAPKLFYKGGLSARYAAGAGVACHISPEKPEDTKKPFYLLLRNTNI